MAVLERMLKDKKLLNIVGRRKIQYLGHVLRRERCKLLQVFLEDLIAGKRPVGQTAELLVEGHVDGWNAHQKNMFCKFSSKIQTAIRVAQFSQRGR